MQLEDGKTYVQTFMGSICSLILFLVVGSYAYQKTDVWISKKDVDIMSSIQTNYFTSDYVFDYDKGLNYAVAFTAYDSETKYILDPSYGNLVFVKYVWG